MEIDKKKIALGESIKELGEYDATIKVYAEVSTCLLYTSRDKKNASLAFLEKYVFIIMNN